MKWETTIDIAHYNESSEQNCFQYHAWPLKQVTIVKYITCYYQVFWFTLEMATVRHGDDSVTDIVTSMGKQFMLETHA